MLLKDNQLTSKEPRPAEKAADPTGTRVKRGRVRIDSLVSGDSPRLSGADKAHVRRLAEAGRHLPPITVHRPNGRIIDGTHRMHAALLNGYEEIEAEFFDGSEDEAFVKAVELNTAHGLPLTMAERKMAAARIIDSCPDLSDRAIARSAGLSGKTVAGIRRSVATGPHPNARRGRDGRVYPVDKNEARRRAAEAIAARPDAPLREVARLAGISVSTAKDIRDRMERAQRPLVPGRKTPTGTAPSLSAPPGQVKNASARTGHWDGVPEISGILGKLKKDPSLRFSDSGREFLRLLQLQCTALDKWPQLADQLPEHCTEVAAQFARHCAGQWGAAARALQERGTLQGPVPGSGPDGLPGRDHC